MNKNILRKIILAAGDWGLLYLSLYLTLLVRYGAAWEMQWANHVRPFSLLFPVWILIVYANYLYEAGSFRPSVDALKSMAGAVFVAFFSSLSLFYLFPPGLIHPRRNLLIFAAIFGFLLLLWRTLAYRLARRAVKTNVLFIGKGEEVEELGDYFRQNPELQYNVVKKLSTTPTKFEELNEIISEEKVKLVLFKPGQASESIKNLFPIMASGVTVVDLEEFYERIFNRVSPAMLDDAWFIRNLENVTQDIHGAGKRLLDILIGVAGTATLAVFYPILALAVKLDSRGPVIFRQKRVGKDGQTFWLYKFRTMKVLSKDGSAEQGSATWTSKNDPRVTRVGKILRKTRIDETPQLWNILLGNMSLVGPRPERPEFVKMLTKKIPYYNMRHLMKPGLTGWAQINHKYGDSVEDARIKLQYDIYYAKKRSITLDLAILTKTVKIILTQQGQ